MLEILTSKEVTLDTFLEEMEKEFILEALLKTNGHQGRAVELLGISVRQLRHRLNKYRLRHHVHNELLKMRSNK